MTLTLTPAQLRDHYETDLSDDALTAVIDANIAAVNRALGVDVAGGSLVLSPYGQEYVIDGRLNGAVISAITETYYGTDTALASDDWELVGSAIRRLNTGTNPRRYWGSPVSITYTPADSPEAVLALIDLCKVSLQFNGVQSETNGSYSYNGADQEAMRRKILNRLAGRGLMLA